MTVFHIITCLTDWAKQVDRIFQIIKLSQRGQLSEPASPWINTQLTRSARAGAPWLAGLAADVTGRKRAEFRGQRGGIPETTWVDLWHSDFFFFQFLKIFFSQSWSGVMNLLLLLVQFNFQAKYHKDFYICHSWLSCTHVLGLY